MENNPKFSDCFTEGQIVEFLIAIALEDQGRIDAVVKNTSEKCKDLLYDRLVSIKDSIDSQSGNENKQNS